MVKTGQNRLNRQNFDKLVDHLTALKFFDADATDKAKIFTWQNLSFDFFGTIPVLPVSAERRFPYFAIESLFRFVSTSACNRFKPQSLSPSNILSFV